MMDHDDYREGMLKVAREEGIDLGLLESAYVERCRVSGMAPWEAVAIIA